MDGPLYRPVCTGSHFSGQISTDPGALEFSGRAQGYLVCIDVCAPGFVYAVPVHGGSTMESESQAVLRGIRSEFRISGYVAEMGLSLVEAEIHILSEQSWIPMMWPWKIHRGHLGQQSGTAYGEAVAVLSVNKDQPLLVAFDLLLPNTLLNPFIAGTTVHRANHGVAHKLNMIRNGSRAFVIAYAVANSTRSRTPPSPWPHDLAVFPPPLLALSLAIAPASCASPSPSHPFRRA